MFCTNLAQDFLAGLSVNITRTDFQHPDCFKQLFVDSSHMEFFSRHKSVNNKTMYVKIHWFVPQEQNVSRSLSYHHNNIILLILSILFFAVDNILFPGEVLLRVGESHDILFRRLIFSICCSDKDFNSVTSWFKFVISPWALSNSLFRSWTCVRKFYSNE